MKGYVEDYNTVEDASPPLNASAKADLYAELATGAESGIDYSIRWCKFKSENVSDNEPVLRGMNVRAQIPPDLNALLSGDHALVRPLLRVHKRQGTDGLARKDVRAVLQYKLRRLQLDHQHIR